MRDTDGDLHPPPLPNVPVSTTETRNINIGGKATISMGKGDRLLIETPGGGGWGVPDEIGHEDEVSDLEHVRQWAARGSLAEREAQQAGFGGF
jgi:5-oxoprolinase (ATP-hydrolysing)